ncbi:hypothetical protein GX51_06160 [Blastomyces parvus]|uniref:Uncharacterized protein n=1 Tax=Blastomyces parvus TaxID=2060905 RepID=A0A2B7WSZ2_9EURO|nr:hypothetical protein GX51_06160 [Blastomyces parvus]
MLATTTASDIWPSKPERQHDSPSASLLGHIHSYWKHFQGHDAAIPDTIGGTCDAASPVPDAPPSFRRAEHSFKTRIINILNAS